jgi:hypothetical protein
MLSLILTAFNALSSPALLQQSSKVLSTEQTIGNYVTKFPSPLETFKTAQNLNLIEAVSPRGYSLKYPANWTIFTTPASDPDSDIFIVRSFPNPTAGLIVTITTTVRDFLVVPKQLPSNVKKFDRVTDIYAGILSQSGYKIYDKKALMINARRAALIVTETPDKKGSITVLIEGEDEKMIVSTSVYPIDNSIISRELLEQVIAEIGTIQNSITIR